MTTRLRSIWLSLCGALLIAFANPAFAEDPADAPGVLEATDSIEQEVQSETDEQAIERRKKIMQEAVDALAKTNDALKALEEERIDDALEALAVTTGKLELIVARDPELSLAPTDVTISMNDLYGTAEAIKASIRRAEEALDDGDVQEARRVLDGLGSEMIITVVNLPLATYPDAIKAISPLIDAGKIEEAKRGLEVALSTLVLTDQVVPLPVLRAEALLERAEELAQKSGRSDEENEQLTHYLDAIRNQLEMAQLLGYGDKRDYKPVYAQLRELEKATADGTSDKSVFDEMRSSMSDLWNSIAS